MDTTMIKNILGAYGPSGREDKAAEAIKQYIAPYADEVYRDTMGNLIAHKRGTSGKKIIYRDFSLLVLWLCLKTA